MLPKLLEIFDKYQRKRDTADYQTEDFKKRLLHYINNQQPIKMLLPGFHCKSINPRSVFSKLPDHAEYIAIKNLENLCQEITAVYPSGCELMLFHEAHLYVDLGVVPDDKTIDAYLEKLTTYIGTSSIKSATLKTVYPQLNSYHDMRQQFLQDFVPTPEHVNTLLKQDDDLLNRYQAYKAFSFHEFIPVLAPHQTLIQQKKLSAKIGKELLRFYLGFVDMTNQYFKDYIRFSILSHPPIKKKISLNLIPNNHYCGSPWFHVLFIKKNGDYDLIKKHYAEQQKYQLIYDINGFPSHYVE